MGWLSLAVIYEMAVKLAAGSVTLLAVGGVVYSLGVIFTSGKRIPVTMPSGTASCSAVVRHFLAIYLLHWAGAAGMPLEIQA